MATAHQLKGTGKSRSRRSSDSPKPSSSTTTPGAARGSHYALGVVPGISAPNSVPALQLQPEAEEQWEDDATEDASNVQMMRPECEAEQRKQQGDAIQTKSESDWSEDELAAADQEEAAQPGMAVQMWDCSDYPKPTCSIQRKEENAEQQEADEDRPVQAMCPECEVELESGESEASSEPDEGEQSAVQMWDCDDYPEPICSIQSKEGSAEDSGEAPDTPDDESGVQAKCAACAKETESEDEAGIQKTATRSTSRQGVRPGSGRKASILRQASEGLRKAHSPLPYRDRIQKSFGRHDISDVRTETGGSAGRASERIGALAYASGNRIGFRSTPTLHLTAHEAAHAVQQRAGLKLPGNVGKPGDRWERHADRVADAVVAGESAEPLLDSVTSSPSRPASRDNVAAVAAGHAHSGTAAGAGSAPANGNGIVSQVQGSITSGATHQVEPEQEEEASSVGVGAAGTAESSGEAPGAEESEAEPTEAAEDTAEAAQENEADAAADCEEAQGEDNAGDEQEAPQQGGGGEQGESGQAAGGPPQKGQCYDAEAPDPPPGAEEPAQDSPQNESRSQAEVTYDDWEEPNDECECAATENIPPNAAEQEVATALPDELAASGETDGISEGEVTTGAGAGQASTGGGSGGAGSGSAEESSEGKFAQGEASRDRAVAALDAAITEVDRVPDRAKKLSKGLRFGGAPAGNAAEEARRAMALKQMSAFMQRATVQIEGAVSFVRDDAPARLGAMAEAVKANIESSMFAEKAAISARIRQSKQTAIAEAEAARNSINTDYETSVTSVNAETDAALQTLNDVYASSTDAIAAQEDTALSEVNRRFQDGRDDHEAKGTTFANAAVATGQDWADEYDKCRARPANDNERNGDDNFTDGCLTVRRAKAQQDAACNTAGGMAKNMVDMAKEKGFNLREQRTQHRCSVIAGAKEAQTTLDSTLEGLISGLESGRASTLDVLAKARDANLSGVDASLEARFQSLAQQEREQRQAVNDSGYVQQVAVEQTAHQVAAGLVNGVSSAMESLEQQLGDLRERLLEGDFPSSDQLAEILSAAEAGMGEGVGTLLEKMEEGASSAEMSLVASGETAASALADITTGNATLSAESDQGFSSELNELVSAASDSMAQLADSHIANAQESTATGTQSMEQLVTGFIETTERIYTQADGVISTSLGELDTELTNMEDGLEAKIAAEAWRAASKEQPAWKGVVAIVLIIIIIIASIVVTVLTAGAAAAALGPILGAAVLGAVVGAVTAGLIQVINNWAAGEDFTKDLWKSIVMGAVGGAIGGAIGAGANGLAQVGVNAAMRAGSSLATRAAINVGVNLAGDMVAEGATQAFGYFAYGQQFNWQGFVTAGAMSAASTARGAGGVAGKYDADASVSGMFRPTGVRGPRPTIRAPTATDAAIGLGIAAGVEGVSYLATGKFDVNRFATSAAGSVGGVTAAGLHARGSRGGGAGAGGAEPPTPRTHAEEPTPTTPRSHADTSATPPPRPSADAGAAAGPPRTTAEAPEPRALRPEVESGGAPPSRTVAPDAELPASVRSMGEPEPSAPTVRSEADTDTTVRGTGEEAESTPTRSPDQDSGSMPRTPVDEAEVPRSRTSHDDSPEIEPGVVARRDLGDGHAVTVLKDGRVITCSACGELRMQYAEELADRLNSAHHDELARIEAMTDPRAKADAAVRLRHNLEVLRSSGISRLPPGVTDGASLARATGLPDAPAGYQWSRHKSSLTLRRSSGGIADNNPPIRYDAETRSFTPAFNAPDGYHWAPKPNGGYTLEHNPGLAGHQPDLRFDAGRNEIVNASTGEPYRSPAPHWRVSEIDTGADLGTGILPGEVPPASTFRPEVSYKGGLEVPMRTRGSSRPDHFATVKITEPAAQRTRTERYAIETKNYRIETPAGRQRLVRTLGRQLRHRARQLPTGTRQIVVVDVRGRSITHTQQEALATQISIATGGAVRASDVVFYD
jgi:hypothetical protein